MLTIAPEMPDLGDYEEKGLSQPGHSRKSVLVHRLIRKVQVDPSTVMPALVAGIHVAAVSNQASGGLPAPPTWMAGTRPAMTNG